MAISRDISLHINAFLDQFIPPFLRDSKWFMYLPMKILLKDKVDIFIKFKDRAFTMTKAEFSEVYSQLATVTSIQGETDLNNKCISEIESSIKGKIVLEVGCGRGFLANKLSKRYKVVATDIIVTNELKKKFPKIKFIQANIEHLPFKDNSFDTVVCTHTLEHVQHITQSIFELRRVAKKRLIIVVPKQRPYKYTFNLHIHFFPYSWSLQGIFGSLRNSMLLDLEDWFYMETY